VYEVDPLVCPPVGFRGVTLSLDVVLDYRMISLRNPKILSIFRLQSAILKLFGENMRGEGFTEIKTSKLIGTEGGTGLFSGEYFDTRVFLALSPLFYGQAMVSSGVEEVFEIGCAYRAEKHETPRHLNEYPMLLEKIELFGLKPEGLADYIQIFKYGCPPHGGFAIGPERLTQKILGAPRRAGCAPKDGVSSRAIGVASFRK